MKRFPVRVFLASSYSDVVMECDDENVAHNGALELVKAGKVKLKKVSEKMKDDRVEGVLIVITLPAKVKKVVSAQKGMRLVSMPGKGSDKIH